MKSPHFPNTLPLSLVNLIRLQRQSTPRIAGAFGLPGVFGFPGVLLS